MIERNRIPGEHLSSMLLGVCNIADGLLRVITLGFFICTFTLDYARKMAHRRYTAQQRRCDDTNAFLRSKLKATNDDVKEILTAAGVVYDEV